MNRADFQAVFLHMALDFRNQRLEVFTFRVEKNLRRAQAQFADFVQRLLNRQRIKTGRGNPQLHVVCPPFLPRGSEYFTPPAAFHS